MSDINITNYIDTKTLEIVKQGNIVFPSDVSITTGTQNVTIDHDLGYLPVVMAFSEVSVDLGDGYDILPLFGFNLSTGVLTHSIKVLVRINDITISLQTVSNGIGVTYNIKYYLLRQRSNTQ